MVTNLTPEQLDELNRQMQRDRGSKGGKAWWASLTDEQKEERKQKLKSSRATKKTEN